MSAWWDKDDPRNDEDHDTSGNRTEGPVKSFDEALADLNATLEKMGPPPCAACNGTGHISLAVAYPYGKGFTPALVEAIRCPCQDKSDPPDLLEPAEYQRRRVLHAARAFLAARGLSMPNLTDPPEDE